MSSSVLVVILKMKKSVRLKISTFYRLYFYLFIQKQLQVYQALIIFATSYNKITTSKFALTTYEIESEYVRHWTFMR